MTFSLRPTYDDPRTAELVDRLRGYLDGELADYERERGITPMGRLTRADLEPVWRRSRELGFYGIHLPKEYGGQNLTYTQLAALKEELGASGRVLSHCVLGDMGGPCARATSSSTPPDTSWTPTCCHLSAVSGRAASLSRRPTPDPMSAPCARSPPGTARATACPGTRSSPPCGPFADFAIVVARMADTGELPDDKPRFSAFLVDLDSPGCRVEDGATPMSGEHIESDIVLDDCWVPTANLLGEEGTGMRIALGRVTTNRLLHCPSVLGATRRALDLTLTRARTRMVA